MEIIIHYTQEFTYIAIFVFLIWCGIGFPLPEDAILIAAGFLVFKEISNLYFTLLVCFLGVMGGDIIIYYAGRKFGLDILKHKRFRRILPEKRLVKIEKMFNRYGTSIVFFARFTAFIRAPLYLSAGALGVRFLTFLFYDFLAAVISIPLVFSVGYYFGEEIEIAVKHVKQIEYLVTVILLAVVFFIIRWHRNRKTAEKRAMEEEALRENSKNTEIS